MDRTWSMEDGFQRWICGVSQPKLLLALVRSEVLAYVSGCHIKFARLTSPVDIFRVFHPICEGIGLLEGFPQQGIFAIAEISVKPRILIYKLERGVEVAVAQIKDIDPTITEYRAIRFSQKDLLITLSGVGGFNISVWKWAMEQHMVTVEANDATLYSDLLISHANDHFWVEWGPDHLTFYDLQPFTQTYVSRIEISLPKNECDAFNPDPRLGSKYSFDIISGAWTHAGNFFVLDEYRGIHLLNIEEKCLVYFGEIPYTHSQYIYRIVAYDAFLAAMVDDGNFLVLEPVEGGGIEVIGTLSFGSALINYIPISTSPDPKTSFYAINDVDRKLECVFDGDIHEGYFLQDLVFAEIKSFCFIEPAADYMAVVTEKGYVFLFGTGHGNVVCRWNLDYFVCSIASHPLLDYVVVGCMDGCSYILEHKDIKHAVPIHRSYYNEGSVIDMLAFMCRGRFLIAADSSAGLMYLQFCIPTMEFEFMDHTNLEGTIRVINTPMNYKDKRFQVLVQKDKTEEVALVLNNFRIDGDSFEIVASQFLDCSITSMCFSNYKRFLYAFSAEKGMGMVPFTEDMNAGSLKEPEISFASSDFGLEVSRLKMHGKDLCTFCEDGFVRLHRPPGPKSQSVEASLSIQTHFSGLNGIRDGVLSLDGCHLVTIGHDNTIVHVQLKAEEERRIEWVDLQCGTNSNIDLMIHQQNLYAKYRGFRIPHELGESEESLSQKLIAEGEFYEVRSSEADVRGILQGLDMIRIEVRSLIELNDTYEDFEKVPLEEFELDEEQEEESRLEFEKNKELCDALVLAMIEEREEWATEMQGFLYDRFETKSCTINGFHIDKEVSNYPLQPVSQEMLQAAEDAKEERRLEKKLFKARKEIARIQAAHNTEVRRLRKARKKGQKKKIDFSRFPPEMKDEMMALLADMATPDSSNSGSDSAKSAPIQDKAGYFERLLEKHSIVESEDSVPELETSKRALQLKKKEEKVKEEEEKKNLPEEYKSIQKVFDDIGRASGSDEEEEGEDEDEEDEEDEDKGSRSSGDEGEEEAEEAPIVEELELSSSSSEHSPQSSASDVGATRKKDKHRIFFGHPSRHALEAQGISAKDAEFILERANKAAKAKVLETAKKEEEQKLAKQKEVEEMEKARQAAFLARHNIKEDLHIAPVFSPLSSGSDEEEEIVEEVNKGPRKKIRVKQKVMVNNVEVEEYVLEDDSSADSDAEVQKELEMDKKMHEYKHQFMSKTHIQRAEFVKRLENGGRVFEFFEMIPGFYPQMEMFALHQHIMQIDLIRHDLQKLQAHFNEEFEAVRKLKETTTVTVKKQNERIREVAEYLNIDIEIPDPELTIWENVESIFVVTNAEINIQPYLTVAEREEAERLRLEEEERKKGRQDDWRERALMVMMDGVLDSRREDILRKDVPKPKFMIQKEQWEWNFEDYKRADDYNALVEQLEILRAEFRKELEIEIRQLVKMNTDVKSIFDKKLETLFQLKQSVEHAVRLEEMKIIRLTRQLMIRDVFQREEDIQTVQLRKMQERMKLAKNVGSEVIAKLERQTEAYDEILNREKSMIADFRGNILEAGPYMETFLRLYKKSPKIQIQPEKLQEFLVLMIEGLDSTNLRIFAQDHGEIGHMVADAIHELDEPIQIPVGCPRATWDKFCRLRRQRVKAEYEAKVTGTELVQLRAVVQECKKHDDEIASDMAQILAQLATQKNQKLSYIQNGEMQLVVPQGCLEADICRAADLRDVTICKTSVVHKLNDFIKGSTSKLVTQLTNSKNLHRTIMQMDWRYRKVQLREKHLLAKKRDIATLRVTKEVLEFLRLHNDFRNVQDQRLIRIRKLQEMSELYHGKYMDGMDKLQKAIQGNANFFEKDSENKEARLEKRNMTYNMLRSKCNVTDPKVVERNRAERIKLIMRTSHLARYYSQMEETIVTLETELERLYDKTYPYL